MPSFSPAQLASWTGGRWTVAPAVPVVGFAIDTRQLRPGEMFVAIRSEQRDGHAFLGAAAAAGAAAALVSRADPAQSLPQLVVPDPLSAFQAIAREHRRQFRGPVVGISGSAGKTSTKDLLALLLEVAPASPGSDAGRGLPTPPAAPARSQGAAGSGDPALQSINSAGAETPSSGAVGAHLGAPMGVASDAAGVRKAAGAGDPALQRSVLATEGNLNNHLGVPLTLTRLDPAVHRFAVVEAGISAPGEMAPLAAMIQPDVALITLVAAAHTEELGGVAGVAQEKAVLPAAVPPTGIAIFPTHCTEFAAFRELDVQQMVVERADVIRPAQPPRDKVYFTVSHRDESTVVALAYGPPPPLAFTLRRVSDGMAQNAALAICAALWLGVPAAVIQQQLDQWQPARLRGELRRENGRWLYLDCYNANPASMNDALEAFYGMAPAAEPRLFVLGGMEELGRDAPRYHHELGRSLRLRAGDEAVVIGEHAPAVRAGALAAGAPAGQVRVAESVEPVAVQVAAWRGAVFVKGSRRYALEKVLAPNPEENPR